MRNSTGDEGGPFGPGDQELSPSHYKPDERIAAIDKHLGFGEKMAS
jgi:hypothetical protein